MRIQTILNRVEKFKSFTYGDIRIEERSDRPALLVNVSPEGIPGRSVPGAVVAAWPTTTSPNAGLSSCPSGESRFSSSIACGG